MGRLCGWLDQRWCWWWDRVDDGHLFGFHSFIIEFDMGFLNIIFFFFHFFILFIVHWIIHWIVILFLIFFGHCFWFFFILLYPISLTFMYNIFFDRLIYVFVFIMYFYWTWHTRRNGQMSIKLVLEANAGQIGSLTRRNWSNHFIPKEFVLLLFILCIYFFSI